MNNKLDVRVYPIDEPQGNTKAFASVAIDDLTAIRGIRVVDSDKGLFVTMPQSQDNSGRYHDVAYPLTAELRKDISDIVLDEFGFQASLAPDERGYETPEPGSFNTRPADEVKLGVELYPIEKPKGDTISFASVALDDTVVIGSIRIVNSDKGLFVSMPQSKDKDGKFHDVAFPLSGDLRKAVSNAVLKQYREATTLRKPSVAEKLADGAARVAQYASGTQNRAVAKGTPGITV